MYVGDRSGTIFRVRDGTRDAVRHAAAERRGVSSGDESRRGAVRQRADARHRTTTSIALTRAARCATVPTSFGRPQGLAFAPDGALHVVDALAGASGVYRFAAA